MNDTHGVEGKPWYGFDLDGTLAVYDKWEGIDHIGEPVKPMVDLIKKMHDEGKVVKIVTARVAPRSNPDVTKTRYPMYAGEDIGDVPEYAARWMNAMREAGHLNDQVEACKFYFNKEWNAHDFVADWCLEHLGFLPEITNEKDYLMLELYDDRVKQVVPNKGVFVEELCCDFIACAKDLRYDNERLQNRLASKWNGFSAGLCIGTLIWLMAILGREAYVEWLADKTPDRVRVEALQKAANDLLSNWPTGK